MKKITITIDGVGGAGKGTTAQGVAKKLGYSYIDSGAMYRVTSFFLNNLNIGFNEDKKIIENLKNLNINFDTNSNVLLNDQNTEKEIRTEKIDNLVFQYAKNPLIRNFINNRQKELLNHGGFVIDGRDMGSVVFPEAELKIYITCDSLIRARRRALQYGTENNHTEIKKIQADFEKRDFEDKNRKHAPLIIPYGASIIDTSNHTIKSQIEEVYNLALQKINQ